jgi:hypothetical protein
MLEEERNRWRFAKAGLVHTGSAQAALTEELSVLIFFSFRRHSQQLRVRDDGASRRPSHMQNSAGSSVSRAFDDEAGRGGQP